MACDAEDCGFQMLNDDEIVTSVQEESDLVDDETDEDEDNNNHQSSIGPSNANAFSARFVHSRNLPFGQRRGIKKYINKNNGKPDQLVLLQKVNNPLALMGHRYKPEKGEERHSNRLPVFFSCGQSNK
ncbi:hypothetical protein TNCV_1256551 [Trichonephila clavipes]|nr:hypothetical protein TNCV_1256551 [Trichonephila clavipes]